MTERADCVSIHGRAAPKAGKTRVRLAPEAEA